MAPEKAPAFQFYPKDFLSDERVQLMSHTERGVYVTLLCMCWLEGSLPSDLASLARLVRMPTARFARLWAGPLGQCFLGKEGGRLGQKRLDQERAKQDVFRQRQRVNGQKGGRPNRKGLGSSGVTQVKPRKSSPISDLPSSLSDLHSPLSGEEQIAVIGDDAFAHFWTAYPKKVGKDDARKAWQKRRPVLAVVLAALDLQREWLARDSGQFIPNPATWLNQGRWQDTPPVVGTAVAAPSKRTLAMHAGTRAFLAAGEK